MELYTDLEWLSHNQKIIVAGFLIPGKLKIQLYDKDLNKDRFLEILSMLDPEKDFIFFHGPDIGYLEKLFKINIRDHYNCINVQKVLSTFTRFKKVSLKRLEKIFKIKRLYKVLEHHEIRRFWKYGGRFKYMVLKYNMEDIINLYKLKTALFEKYQITPDQLMGIRLTQNASSKKNRKKYKY